MWNLYLLKPPWWLTFGLLEERSGISYKYYAVLPRSLDTLRTHYYLRQDEDSRAGGLIYNAVFFLQKRLRRASSRDISKYCELHECVSVVHDKDLDNISDRIHELMTWSIENITRNIRKQKK